jgi:hypothetical protein
MQIGEVALMKDMTSMATSAMTEEEKEELEKAMRGNGSPAGTPSISANAHADPTHPPRTPGDPLHPPKDGDTPPPSSPSPSELKAKKGRKLTPEQKEKLEALDKERREKMKKRVDDLAIKLIDRLRPFIEATSEAEAKLWEERMRKEADDLKIESFGVEVSDFTSQCLGY